MDSQLRELQASFGKFRMSMNSSAHHRLVQRDERCLLARDTSKSSRPKFYSPVLHPPSQRPAYSAQLSKSMHNSRYRAQCKVHRQLADSRASSIALSFCHCRLQRQKAHVQSPWGARLFKPSQQDAREGNSWRLANFNKYTHLCSKSIGAPVSAAAARRCSG